MNPVAIVHASRQGETRRVAERAARELRLRGIATEVRNAVTEANGIDVPDYSGVILAGTIGLGRTEPELIQFVRKNRAELETLPTGFLAVSLPGVSVALDESPGERQGSESGNTNSLEEFFAETGWHPARVKLVAGSVMLTKSTSWMRFLLRRIPGKARRAQAAAQNYGNVAGVALGGFIEEFALEVLAASSSDAAA